MKTDKIFNILKISFGQPQEEMFSVGRILSFYSARCLNRLTENTDYKTFCGGNFGCIASMEQFTFKM
jgi:hypothetical protein